MKGAVLASLVLVVMLPVTAAGPAVAGTTKSAPTGTLTISGSLQDGITLSAQAVTWTPSPCQHGICSRALTVGYTWQTCRGTNCGPPSIPPNQRALDTMLLGPGDVGRTIRVTETATEVVRTSPSSGRSVVAGIHARPGLRRGAVRAVLLLPGVHAGPGGGQPGVQPERQTLRYGALRERRQMGRRGRVPAFEGQPRSVPAGKAMPRPANYTTFCQTVWPLPPSGFGFAAWRADVNLDAAVFDHCWP